MISNNIFNMILALLKNLGFLVKLEKCTLFPTQKIVFLGALLDSRKMTIAVPTEKLHNLQQKCAEVDKKKGCSMQELAAIIGRMNQMARTGIHPAPIFNYQPCIHHMPTQEGTAHTTRQVQISLNLQALEELPVVDLISDFTAQWCSTIHPPPPQID